jgi:hypothetical protein
MYVNPFLAGIISTILFELILILVAAVIFTISDRKKK